MHGYHKAKVYTNRPRTIQELKVSIRQEIAAVPEDMLENALQNFEERLQMCVQQEGRHLTDIIFRT
jgi:vacuolar-type H+-ATPase subunit E/Vma4